MKKLFTICAALLLLASCAKEDDNMMSPKSMASHSNDIETNTRIDDYAKVLSFAVKNQEIRTILYNKAQEMLDGDYDILVKDFHNTMMQEGKTVSEYLNRIIENQYRNQLPFQNLPDIITREIPNLQISIPVNIDMWNDASLVPTIITIPCNLDDMPSAPDYLHSFRNGHLDSINVSNEPHFPVVAVGISERISRTGIRIADSLRAASIININPAPLAPGNLSIHYTAPNSALLRWNDVSANEGYYIYSTLNGNWCLIDSTGQNENMFGINNLITGETYTFAIRSKNSNGVSSFSHTAKIKATNRGDNKPLYVDSIYISSTRLRDIEPWYCGGPELLLNIYSSSANHDSTRYFNSIRVEPSRNEIKDRWYNCHQELTTSWGESPCTILLFAWDEINTRFNYSVNVLAKYAPDSLKIANGTLYVNAEASYNATSNDKVVSRRDVSFWDSKRHEYQENGFKFICTSND